LNLRIRRFTWVDIEAIARIHRASEPVDHAGRTLEAKALLQRWRSPGTNPGEECLIAEARGRLVGYALRWWVHGTDRCLVDGAVHPAWRRRGIARQLLARTAEEARLAGARSLDLRAHEDEEPAVAFAQGLALALVRRWYRMWLQPLRVPPFAFPPGYGWRSFRPRHDQAAYTAIVNATFAEHWGIGLTTAEGVARMVTQPGFEPSSIIFATRQRGVVGVCVTRLAERQVGTRRFPVALVGPLGVCAAHRGHGLAHALLSTSLRQCHRRRIQAAELEVDEGNRPAIHVYEDCGFETLFRILWYRQDLKEENHG